MESRPIGQEAAFLRYIPGRAPGCLTGPAGWGYTAPPPSPSGRPACFRPTPAWGGGPLPSVAGRRLGFAVSGGTAPGIPTRYTHPYTHPVHPPGPHQLHGTPSACTVGAPETCTYDRFQGHVGEPRGVEHRYKPAWI